MVSRLCTRLLRGRRRSRWRFARPIAGLHRRLCRLLIASPLSCPLDQENYDPAAELRDRATQEEQAPPTDDGQNQDQGGFEPLPPGEIGGW